MKWFTTKIVIIACKCLCYRATPPDRFARSRMDFNMDAPWIDFLNNSQNHYVIGRHSFFDYLPTGIS